MADPGRLAGWGTGREPAPAASPAASPDAPPSPTQAVVPGAVGESGPAGPAVTDDTHAVVEDAVPDVPLRAGLPLALVAIVGGSLVQPRDPAVLSEAPETAVAA